MKTSPTDVQAMKVVAGLLGKIDTIDVTYVDRTSDELYRYQPFLLSLLLGYQLDLPLVQVEEIMKIYFLIWEYFKDQNNIKKKAITQARFEKAEKRNIAMLQYGEGETTLAEKMEVTALDLENIRSKALYTGIYYRFEQRPVLAVMDPNIRGMLLMGIKSLLECFEQIQSGKQAYPRLSIFNILIG